MTTTRSMFSTSRSSGYRARAQSAAAALAAGVAVDHRVSLSLRQQLPDAQRILPGPQRQRARVAAAGSADHQPQHVRLQLQQRAESSHPSGQCLDRLEHRLAIHPAPGHLGAASTRTRICFGSSFMSTAARSATGCRSMPACITKPVRLLRPDTSWIPMTSAARCNSPSGVPGAKPRSSPATPAAT